MFGTNLVIATQIHYKLSRGQNEFPRILNQNGKNDLEGQGQWPLFSIPTPTIPGCMSGANFVILTQICDELACRQGKVYGWTDRWTDGLTGQTQAMTIPLRSERAMGKNGYGWMGPGIYSNIPGPLFTDERLAEISREVSKPWDWMLSWSYHSEIWQASRRRCSRCACQRLERLEKSIRISWLRHITRSCGKTSVRLANRGPGNRFHGWLWLDVVGCRCRTILPIFFGIHWYASHYNDVIMGAMASQITSLMIVYLTVYSGGDQRKHQSSASLAFVWGIHRWPVNSPHKWPVTRKKFPFDGVIMPNWIRPKKIWVW